MNDGLNHLRVTFGKVLIGVLWALAAIIVGIAVVRGQAVLSMLVLGVAFAGLSTALWMRDPVGPLTRYISSASTVGIVALLVFEHTGSAYQIDMHMAFFAALAIVAVWCCWMSVVFAGATVALHHLILNFIYPYAVFPDGSDLPRVLIHAVIVVAQVAALAYLTNRVVAALNQAEAAGAEALTAEAERVKLTDKERDRLHQQEQRRGDIDAAILTFRERIKDVMTTVHQSSNLVKSTALQLSGSSAETSKRVEDAVGTSSDGARNAETAAAAAEEMSNSIGQISRDLARTADIARVATQEAETTNGQIAGLAQAALPGRPICSRSMPPSKRRAPAKPAVASRSWRPRLSRSRCRPPRRPRKSPGRSPLFRPRPRSPLRRSAELPRACRKSTRTRRPSQAPSKSNAQRPTRSPATWQTRRAAPRRSSRSSAS
jgi:methyl-accepting chemotaxis protein